MSDSSLESLRLACANPVIPHAPDWPRQASAEVLDSILRDYENLDVLPIGKTASRPEMDRHLAEPPPEQACDFARLLDEFHAKIVGNSFRPSHPRFWAFIGSAPTFASILAEFLAANANLFAGVWKEAAGAAEVELVVLEWFRQFLGLPAGTLGLLTGGGSEATLTALTVAREKLTCDDRSRCVLYASQHRHWSVDRGAKIIGLRPDQIHALPCDAEYRLRVENLQQAIDADLQRGLLPWAVLANAGTTNTGSIDPLVEIAATCNRHRLWLHVDAAYGWPMVLLEEGKRLLAGIEQADSITLDPHKWFAQPFDAGCLLVRRGELLARTFTMRPEYMQDVVPGADEINFCDQGIALTRRFRALKIWMSMRLLGVGWFRSLIAHNCTLARYAEALVQSKDCFELTSTAKLSIICFRYVPRDRQWPAAELDALQQAIAADLLASGLAFISTTRLHGRSTLRFCFVNWRTTAADVDAVVAALTEIGDRLSGTNSLFSIRK